MKITAPLSSGRASGSGGGSAGGPAGGDLGGTLPGPVVTGIQGVPVCVTAPVLGDVLTFDGTQWCPSTGGSVPGFLTSNYGEQAALVTVAASGAAYAIDCSLADSWDITLSAACTLSLVNPAPSGVDSHIEVNLRGNYAVTFPAELTFYDPTTGLAVANPDWTTLDASVQVPMEWTSVDGGTSWGCELPLAFVTFGGATTLAGLADVSLSSLANADRLRYSTVDNKWHNSALIWTPLTVYDGTNWLPLVDGSGNAVMAEA
ncbi:MAG: hypothetical protein PHS14_13125 [Elusimicrobia bacterium]|nr:hypothetical protein [Elusimicrobiota bacterium]